MLTIDILTLFPPMFPAVLDDSILRRAQEKRLVNFAVRNIRAWTHDRHHVTDDTPYGGGGGMVMKPEPVIEALEAVKGERGNDAGPVIYLSPQGKMLTHDLARRLAAQRQFTLLCGHYEGIDERVREGGWIDDELTIGDYVLTGGELAAMVVVDSVTRLIPGVLGNEASAANDSFATGLLDCPHYTRPAEFRGMSVPEVLTSGHHAKVEQWRREEALRRTLERRPELLDKADLSPEDRRFLQRLREERRR